MAEQVRQSVVSKLLVAVRNGRFSDVRRQLKKATLSEVNFRHKDIYGSTLLHFTANKGNLDIVECLIGAKADVDQAKNDGVTPLIMSAHRGHFNIVKTLIRHGANPTLEFQQGGHGYTAQQNATDANHPEIAAYLEEATRATTNLTPLHHACFTRNISRLLALFRSDAVPSAMLNQPAPPGGTPVEIAEASKIPNATIELLPVCERTL